MKNTDSTGIARFYLPLLDGHGDELIAQAEVRLALARRLRDSGWPYRQAALGLLFETPEVEIDIAERLAALGVPRVSAATDRRGVLDAIPTLAEYYAAHRGHSRGSGNGESPWLRFGELSLPSGDLMIGDPLLPPQKHRSVSLPSGNYLILVRANSVSRYWNLTRVRITRSLSGTPGEPVAEVTVNLDRLGFYDRELGDAVNPTVPVSTGDGDRTFEIRRLTVEETWICNGIEIGLEKPFREPDDGHDRPVILTIDEMDHIPF